MQRVEARRRPSRNELADSQGKRGLAVESPRRERIAQLETLARSGPRARDHARLATVMEASPLMAVQRRVEHVIDNSPRQAAQRKVAGSIRNDRRISMGRRTPEDAFGGEAAHAGAEESPRPEVARRERARANSNNTGLPDKLKSGVESLSGMSMDGVRVHYNSAKPAQLNALAYTQGTEIHVAPGQEKHLPHEAWHVVQQAQGRVRPTMQMKGVRINDEEGLEKEADAMGEQAESGMAQAKESPVSKRDVKIGSVMVQKRPRKARVVWNVTHEVFPDESISLFGDERDPFRNEGRELHHGDEVVVDDEDIFQSRRGANQEVFRRRQDDKAGHLTNKWLKLESVNGSKTRGDGYVREETISIEKESGERREITTKQEDVENAKSAGDEIFGAWSGFRKNRRMSAGAWKRWEEERQKKGKETSPSWDQIEEGYDVSRQLSHHAPIEHRNYGVEEKGNQAIFTAYDVETRAPIGIIVIERRASAEFPRYNDDSNKKWYLRWLIGHPTLKGAGGQLLGSALSYVRKNGGKAVWVESAPSAVGWYKSKEFKPVTKQEQMEYNEEFDEGWDSLLMVLDLA